MPKSILKKPKADLKKPKVVLKKPKAVPKKPKSTLKKPKATSIDKLNIILNEELNNITSEKIKKIKYLINKITNEYISKKYVSKSFVKYVKEKFKTKQGLKGGLNQYNGIYATLPDVAYQALDYQTQNLPPLYNSSSYQPQYQQPQYQQPQYQQPQYQQPQYQQPQYQQPQYPQPQYPQPYQQPQYQQRGYPQPYQQPQYQQRGYPQPQQQSIDYNKISNKNMIYHLHGLLSAIKSKNDNEIEYHKNGYDIAKKIKADPQAANIAEMQNNSRYNEFSKKKFLTFFNDKTADVRQKTHYEKQFLQNPANKYDMPRVSDLQNIENPSEDLIKKLERQKESQTASKNINDAYPQQKQETPPKEDLPPIRHENQSTNLRQENSDTPSLYERRSYDNLDDKYIKQRQTPASQEDQIPPTINGDSRAREFQQRRSDAHVVARYRNEQAFARDAPAPQQKPTTSSQPSVLKTKPDDQQRSTQFQNQQKLSNLNKFYNMTKESYKGNIKYNQTSKGSYEVGGKIKRHNNGGFKSKLFEKKFLNNLKLRSQPKKKSDNDKIQYGNTTNYGIRNNYERPNYGTKNRFEENSNYGIKNQFEKKSITKSLNYRR